ncbi:tigger transposable element-derived protein 6-like [Rhizophagus irregularis DAOM 181602=DAOM 197198]|nr:tigger transposable element-derived protein 6-like [Rhizophagus irregularis DAOM 181602=DAOM 197198]
MMTQSNQLKKHRSAISDDYPNLTIERSTISKILLQKDKWKTVLENEKSNKIFKHKPVKFPMLDRAMNIWVENVTAGGVILTDLLIKEKARVFAELFESGSAPLASLPEERAKLHQLLSRFTPDQIYNIDETGLYYRMPPNQTLSSKPVLGQKKDKTRITVLLGTNAIGTDKLKPWVIGNSKRPRPLSRVNFNHLPVHYRGNPKAWMNSEIFEEVLLDMDRHFRLQNKRILLLIDNAPSHFDPNYHPPEDEMEDLESTKNQGRRRRRQPNISRLQLTHVEVAFLPPNTTSHLQPLDAGIIASFKNHYKRNYCRHMLELFEKDINKEKINIKESIDYLTDAWENVTEETIHNCWIKTGILPSSTNEDITDATQAQREKIDDEVANINQIIRELGATEDPRGAVLADAINDYFLDLEKEIPTEDVLDDNDIVRLIQEEMCDGEINEIDSEKEEIQVSLDNALKSIQTWISFFEQQQSDEFNIDDLYIFKKYFKITKRLEFQSKKQIQITQFF